MMKRAFSDTAMVAGYAEGTRRRVPGLDDLHRMAMLLLAERADETARILVVGAGGGMELKSFADAQPRWTFVGIDPSKQMLDLARETLGPLLRRVELLDGHAHTAPPGPFDGATCLLTLHFLPPDERLQMLREIRQRLKPGAQVVVAHHSYPSGSDFRQWLSRSVAFAGGPDADFEQARASADNMADQLHVLSEEDDEAIFVEAGFSQVALFYAGFSFRGWVACA